MPTPEASGFVAAVPRMRDHRKINKRNDDGPASAGPPLQLLWATFAFLALLVSEASGQQPVYVEAEQFQFAGEWIVQSDTAAFNGACIQTTGTRDAATVLSLPQAGTYQVWARSRDFDTLPGTRRFQVGVDGDLFAFQAGAHGVNGWLWENVGSRTLTAGTHVFTIHDVTHYFARCDAIYIVADGTDPNTLSAAQLSASALASTPVSSFWSVDCPAGVMLRFQDATEVTANIRPLLNGTALAYDATDGGVLRCKPNGVATALLDTTAADGTVTTNQFVNPTVSVDVRFGAAGQSFGIFTRVPATEDNSLLTLVNCDASGTNDVYRQFAAGTNPKTGNVSSTLLNQTSDDLTPGTWYTFRVTPQNNGAGSVTFSLEILDRYSGVSLVKKSVTAPSGALTAAGEVGVRFFSNGGVNAIDVDNLSVTENAPGLQSAAPPSQAAILSGSDTRVVFYSQLDVNDETQVTRETQVLVSGTWTPVPVKSGGERLYLLYRNGIAADQDGHFYPRWTQRVDFDFRGALVQTGLISLDPFIAGQSDLLIPRSVQQIDPQTVLVTCRGLSGRTATVTWKIGAGAGDCLVSVAFTADRAGNYSFAFCGFEPTDKAQVGFNLLPPLYQFQRLPSTPRMLTSSVMPQPLAVVQKNVSGFSSGASFCVAADPATMPFEWPNISNATHGFSLLNSDGNVQPSVFSPVLGLAGSYCDSGSTVSAKWRVLFRPGDWKQALEYASNQIFGVTDFRKPNGVSLTDAALNMLDLIKNDVASGWDANLRAPDQIESQSTVTQASPLTFVSMALLTRDESLYRTRSLPTIEYTLSRPSAHFAADIAPGTLASYVSAAATQITIPTNAFGTSYWQGVHDLLARKNSWISDLSLKSDGSVRQGGGVAPTWTEKLGKYRLNPSPTLLQEIETDCQAFLCSEVYGTKTGELALESFYHVSFYPYWWALLDLYEVTGKSIYLNAAEEGAFHTLAGVFSHPMPPAGNVTIHPGGQYVGTTNTIWWKGAVPYRLGFPRVAGDSPERSVPAWLVSPVGFSLEQPTTYYQPAPSVAAHNIQMMSSWAAPLMRLYRFTGRSIYQVYARNAVIGRQGNYPGYYYRGFTDLYLDPQYPYTGPDVTSIYYHHIPARLASVVDYLMAQAESWSLGQVAFPWVKQQGYVWFTNRIFGHAPGTVFGDTAAWPWLDRSVAQVDSPQVDWFLARSPNYFWAILMNQGDTSVTVNLTTQGSKLGIVPDQPVLVYEKGQQRSGSLAYASPLAVSIPAKTLVAVRFTTQIRDVFPRTPSLVGGKTSLALPSPWGIMNAFRTRSPFGSDSLYVVLTGRPASGSTARLWLNGSVVAEKTSYPYEFDVYPCAMGQDMTFNLELVSSGSSSLTQSLVLPGTTTTVPSAYDQWKTDHGIPASLADSQDQNGEGVPVLVKYALNLESLAKSRQGLPVARQNGSRLELSYTKWRDDVAYWVETSTDLKTWTAVGVDQGGDGPSVIASVANSADPRRYLRLRVSRN